MQSQNKTSFANGLLKKAGRLLMPLALGLSLTILTLALLGADTHIVQARPLALDHSGAIISNETWTAAASPHVLTGDVTVASGVTLTIEAGAIVQGNANARLAVNGHLEAVGTPANPITFTSSSGAAGDWEGLYFYGGGINQGTGRLRHATVRYGGDIQYANIYVYDVTDGQVLIESS